MMEDEFGLPRVIPGVFFYWYAQIMADAPAFVTVIK